jgi:four helix bundle protein
MLNKNMGHPATDLKERTKQFALRVLKIVRALPPGMEGRIVGNQLLRAGTSVAPNYRAVCRARSRPDFLSKLAIVIEEADETAFWLEFLVDAGLVSDKTMKDLLSEANQLIAIFNASKTTAK